MTENTLSWPGTYLVLLDGKPVGRTVRADSFDDAIRKIRARHRLRRIPKSRFDAARLPERQARVRYLRLDVGRSE